MSCSRSDEIRFEEFVGLISALSKEVQRIKTTESSHMGLQGADIMILYYLGHSEHGMTGAELARAAGVTRAAVSRTLSHMEREGFVRIDASEDKKTRYRVPVVLTERGRAAADRADERIGYVMRTVASVQTSRDRMVMYASLKNVLDCLKGISRD